MCVENSGTQAGVHSMEGICLIWGPFSTGFTVLEKVIFEGKNTRLPSAPNLSNA